MLMREKEMKFRVSVMDLVALMLLALVQSIAAMSVEFSWLSGIQSYEQVELHTTKKVLLDNFHSDSCTLGFNQRVKI